MEALNEFPKDFTKTFQYSHRLLDRFNIRYLKKNQSFIQKYWRFIYLTPIALIHLVASGVDLAIQLSLKDMINLTYMVPVYLVCIRSVLKTLVIISKRDETSIIIKELGLMWSREYTKKQTIKRNAMLRKLNICITANYWVAYLGTWQFLTAPLLETLYRKFILHQRCELKLPVSYPINFNENLVFYSFVYIFQCYTMSMVVYIHLGCWLMLINLCALLAIEFTMLKHDLVSVNRSEYVDINSIKEIIKRHQKLIKLTAQLDNVYNLLIFIDLLFVGILTCAFVFAGQFAPGKLYKIYNYVAVMSTMVTVFCMCYYGDLLTKASEQLGDIAYNSLWYKGDTHYKKAIWLIIKKCQKPCYLTSIRYTKISLSMFTKVMSSTWSYLSLMNSVYEEDGEQSTML